jgi:hypothetical protein
LDDGAVLVGVGTPDVAVDSVLVVDDHAVFRVAPVEGPTPVDERVRLAVVVADGEDEAPAARR